MRIDTGKFYRFAVIAIALAFLLGALVMFLMIGVTGHRIIKKDEYKAATELNERYPDLYEIDKDIRKDFLYDSRDVSQDEVYKAMVASLGDDYSEYMTREEAERWRKAVETPDTVEREMLNDDIGYIRISAFGKNTASDLQSAIDFIEAKSAKSFILDIRDNGGGYFDQGIEVADILLPECTITSLEGKNKKRKYYNSDEKSVSMKFVLLTDGNTASASEIVAAAIKDNKKGEIVGTKTHGKGVTQKTYDFKDGAMLKLTVFQYFTPKGNKINGRGVEPDHEVDAEPYFPRSEAGEYDDQVKKAMELLS